MMPRQLRSAQQHYGVFHAAPAIHQDEDRKHAEPGGTYPHCYEVINPATPMKPTITSSLRIVLRARPMGYHSKARRSVFAFRHREDRWAAC